MTLISIAFGRAAEKVHVDQSPFSRTIKELEEELGASLFVRTTRNTKLTSAGQALLAIRAAHLHGIDQYAMPEFDRQTAGSKGYCASRYPIAFLRVCLPLLALCREEDPDVEVKRTGALGSAD